MTGMSSEKVLRQVYCVDVLAEFLFNSECQQVLCNILILSIFFSVFFLSSVFFFLFCLLCFLFFFIFYIFLVALII